MNFRDFRLIWPMAFVESADLESFSKASKVLGVDKSSAGRYVERLEDWYHGLLFRQGSVPLELTFDGQKFLPIAREIVRMLEAAVFKEEAKERQPPPSAKDIRI